MGRPENTSGYLDGPLAEAQFNQPGQMARRSRKEAIYVTDTENHLHPQDHPVERVRLDLRRNPQIVGYQNGPADMAKFNKPIGLAITSEGNLYVGDSENYAIRRIAIE